jgi:hypothetical protein
VLYFVLNEDSKSRLLTDVEVTASPSLCDCAVAASSVDDMSSFFFLLPSEKDSSIRLQSQVM